MTFEFSIQPAHAALLALLALAACSRPPSGASQDAGDGSLDMGALDTGPSADASADDGSEQTDARTDLQDAPPDTDPDAGADVYPGPDLGDCVPAPTDLPYLRSMPSMLSQTGLHADFDARTLNEGVQTFEPQFPLWSDGATKTRYVYLPSCPKIDNSDPDHWSMPVGARFWKDFEVDGRVLETRFFYRFGNGEDDFYFGAYAWAEDGSDAALTISGVPDALGTTHDIPSIHGCEGCHLRLPDRILGFSAIQLDHDGPGVTLDELAERLEQPSPSITIPGDEVAQQALGYMHSNCGSCHNDSAHAVQLLSRPLDLRLSVADQVVADTGVSRTAVGVPVDRASHPTCDTRIVPGSSSTSCLKLRMELRGPTESMPPIASEIPDPNGIAAIEAWIDAL